MDDERIAFDLFAVFIHILFGGSGDDGEASVFLPEPDCMVI